MSKEGALHSEKNILQEIAAGSEAAFRELFQAYRKKLFTYVYKIIESREVAEDAVQEIFLKLWSIRETLPAINNINAYLHRMAHNYAYHGFRQLAKEELMLDYLKRQDIAGDNA